MAEDEVRIDAKLFCDRLTSFVSAWKNDTRPTATSVFGGAGSILILTGKSSGALTFDKTAAAHYWLLGYEFPTTLLLFTQEKLYVVTTAKKAKYFDGIAEKLEQHSKGDVKLGLEVLVRGKDAEANKGFFQKVADEIKAKGVSEQLCSA